MLELNKIHLGDCLELMQHIPDNSVDMVLCDLPYGTTDCAWDVVVPFVPLWEHYKRIITNGGSFVLFSSQPFTNDLINSQKNAFKYELIWAKNKQSGFMNAKNKPLKAHENILVFSYSSMGHQSLLNENRQKYYPQDLLFINKKKTGRKQFNGHIRARPSHKTEFIQEYEGYPSTVLFFDSETKTEHPTQKPVALLEYLIRTYTNEGETVLDNTCGSGSTCVAAINTNRNYIGIEKEPKYHAIAERRCKEAAIQPKLFY